MDTNTQKYPLTKWQKDFLAEIDAAPDPAVAEFIERVKATAKGPQLPAIPPPSDLSGACFHMLIDGGRIPTAIARYEHEGFTTAIVRLALFGWPTERRGDDLYLAANTGKGSLHELRDRLRDSPEGMLFADWCKLEARALLGRLNFYRERDELQARAEARTERAKRKAAKLAASMEGEKQ